MKDLSLLELYKAIKEEMDRLGYAEDDTEICDSDFAGICVEIRGKTIKEDHFGIVTSFYRESGSWWIGCRDMDDN